MAITKNIVKVKVDNEEYDIIADNAINAVNAQRAESAAIADSATVATSAQRATLADTATTAETATTAQVAETANNATQAEVALTANYATSSGGSATIILNKDNWEADSTRGGFKQTIEVTGLTNSSSCVVDALIPKKDDIDTINSLWSNIYFAETIDGGITVYSSIALEQDLTITLKW